MGVDIGVCKYIPEREERLKRLKILSRLPGEEGKKYNEELDEIYDNEIHKEYDEIYETNKNNENLGLIGARMFNLWYEINTGTVEIEFSFYNKYSEIRVYPDELKRIIADMKRLLPISDMKERMEYMIGFLEWIVENNYMIYPA